MTVLNDFPLALCLCWVVLVRPSPSTPTQGSVLSIFPYIVNPCHHQRQVPRGQSATLLPPIQISVAVLKFLQSKIPVFYFVHPLFLAVVLLPGSTYTLLVK